MKPRNSNPNVDGGWAWVIFFAAFLNFFLCGVLYCAGIFNVKFLEIYGESKGTTAWSGALQLGLFSLAAPIGSLSNNLFGPRITIFIGSAFTSAGFILTYFAKTYIHTVITYGILVGFGFCLSYYSSLVMIGFYFSRYRNLAYGFSLTGIGAGIMVFPGIIEILVQQYSLSGTMLIMGAIQAHMFVVGALTRPFNQKQTEVFENHTDSKVDDSGHAKLNIAEKLSNSHLCLKIESDKEVRKDSNSNISTSVDVGQCQDIKNNFTNQVVLVDSPCVQKALLSDSLTGNKDDFNSDLCTKQDTDTARLTDKEGCLHRNADLLTLPFLVYLICLFFQGVGLYSMYVHFPAYVDSIGVSPEYNSILMAAMGGGSLACRIVVGITTNGSKSRTMIAFISSSYMTGLTCAIGPYLCLGYIGQFTFAILFSFFGNIYIALMSPVVIDLIGLERSVLTTGIALFVIGVGVVGGPPFIGALADLTGTYFYTFPTIAICYFIGGIVMTMIPIQRCLKKTTSEPAPIYFKTLQVEVPPVK